MVPYKRLEEERARTRHVKNSWAFPGVDTTAPRINLRPRIQPWVRTERDEANRRRGRVEHNQTHRKMAAASRRRNRG